MVVLTAGRAGDDNLSLQAIRALRDNGAIVDLGTILQDARRRYAGGRLVEAELEREDGSYIYEIEFLDHAGELRELYYDATTGELLAYEVYATDDDTLQSIKYDARTDTPMAIEIEQIDKDGRTYRQEIDIHTGTPLRKEDD